MMASSALKTLEFLEIQTEKEDVVVECSTRPEGVICAELIVGIVSWRNAVVEGFEDAWWA